MFGCLPSQRINRISLNVCLPSVAVLDIDVTFFTATDAPVCLSCAATTMPYVPADPENSDTGIKRAKARVLSYLTSTEDFVWSVPRRDWLKPLAIGLETVQGVGLSVCSLS